MAGSGLQKIAFSLLIVLQLGVAAGVIGGL